MNNRKREFNIIIRRAHESDCIKIRNTHIASIQKICSKDYSPMEIEAWSKRLKPLGYRKGMESGEIFYVAVFKNRILGFSCLVKDEVRAVYIHPNYIRKSVGTRLLKAIEKYSLKMGVKALNLKSTLTALPFYKTHGYKTLGRSFHKLRSGVKIPCIKMRKILIEESK